MASRGCNQAVERLAPEDWLLFIELEDFSANRFNEAGRIAGRARHQRHERKRLLRVGFIGLWQRLLAQTIRLHVADDTDDLPINFRIVTEQAGQLNTFADGVLIREISLRHRTVDDGDTKRAFRIELGEEAAPQQRDAYRSEIVRTHRVVIGTGR